MTIPPPGRVPRRSSDLSRIGVDDGGGSGPVEENMNTVLGFLVWGVYVGERAKSVAPRGAHTWSSRGQGCCRASTWWRRLGGHFVSCSAFWNVPDEKLTSEKKSSNSENISLSTFLKPKTAENRELALWHLVNRLVPENA